MTETEHSPAEGPRVLVVDDDAGLRHLLEYGLGRAGFTVRSAPDGQAGLSLLREYSPDLVVLDVMLPERDGIALLPEFRRLTTVPVVMLTASTELTQKLAGFSAGADDYVAKPFDLDELIARLRTLLRRPQFERTETLEYADLILDLVRRTVTRGRRHIDLSPREFDLLRTFAERPEAVLTRSELLDLVWGIDRDVIPNTVETYVSYLRAKIDSGERVKLIQTLRGVGYALKASSG
ncbi:MAG TPA: response regulator transcription factor [Candidatus Baltobacteraceae bacterium]|nr:response regulator transcription factor [Candidatus Baltobacteraceae bacterium]